MENLEMAEKKAKFGFTLVELMIVVTIMAMLATFFVINLGGQKAVRSINIAQNELVSNIRKTQSYLLSARSLASGQSAQYYILKFDLSKPTQYQIVALYNTLSSPRLTPVETINLPQGIRFATTSAANMTINVTRALNPSPQPMYSNCALVSFGAPFAKVIFNDGCLPDITVDPTTISLSDGNDYSKIINFQNNVTCAVVSPYQPAVCSSSTDSIMAITLMDDKKTISRTVYINGISGAVSAAN